MSWFVAFSVSFARRLRLASGALAMLVALPSASADIRALLVTSFEDKAGTPLSKVAVQPRGIKWSRDVSGLETTGRGALRLRFKEDQEGRGAMAFVPLKGLVKAGEPLWLIVEFDGWKLSGARNEQLRIGFMHTATGDNPQPLAQMRFTRGSAGVLLAGEAFSAAQGATHIPSQRVAPAEVSARQVFALEYAPAENRYTLYRHTGGEDFQALGSGVTAASRKPNFIRIHVRGDFASEEDEFMDLGHLLLFTPAAAAASKG